MEVDDTWSIDGACILLQLCFCLALMMLIGRLFVLLMLPIAGEIAITTELFQIDERSFKFATINNKESWTNRQDHRIRVKTNEYLSVQ